MGSIHSQVIDYVSAFLLINIKSYLAVRTITKPRAMNYGIYYQKSRTI
jgi:hypothetical protein